MKNLSIPFSAYLLLGCALLCGLAISTWQLLRSTSDSAKSSANIQQVNAQAQQAYLLQVTFEKQALAWQKILLSGQDTASLQRSTAQFHVISARLDQDSSALAPLIQNQQARTELESFREQIQLLDGQYEQALQQYTADRDPARAAATVQGLARIPADQLVHVAARLTTLANRIPPEESVRLFHQQAILQTALLFLGFAFGIWTVAFAHSRGLRLSAGLSSLRRFALALRPSAKVAHHRPRTRHRPI